MLHIETSALDSTNVETAFHAILDQIYVEMSKNISAGEGADGGGSGAGGSRIHIDDSADDVPTRGNGCCGN